MFVHLDNKSNKIIKLKFIFNLGHIDTLLFGGKLWGKFLDNEGRKRQREAEAERMHWRARQGVYDQQKGHGHS